VMFGTPSAGLDLRLPGQWSQAETGGLFQNWNRDYDPTLGRYVEADPLGIEAGQNSYAYVDGDSLNNSDPEGLWGSFFKWYGNWGGPGWASGGWRSESGPIPGPGQPGYHAPIDAQDACYMLHDLCIHDIQMCTIRGNPYVRQCDIRLHYCLDVLRRKTMRSRITSWGFSGFVPKHVH